MSDAEKRKTFLSILEEFSHKKVEPEEEPLQVGDNSDLPFDFTEELDHQILMHRDAHFGGDFGVMLQYYEDEGVGCHPEFDLDRIAYLAQVQEGLGKDLAPLLLSGPEAEQVARSRMAYAKLKELYSDEQAESYFPTLLADLILSEEFEPEEEIEAIVKVGEAILPELIGLLRLEESYSPLFPGYGLAPERAAHCLGKIGNAEAIIPLFEALAKPPPFDDLAVLEAMDQIGLPARDFLLTALKARPLTQDNHHAAFALTVFSEDPKVNKVALDELMKDEVQSEAVLRSYLVNLCEGLQNPPDREALRLLAQKSSTPHALRQNIQTILHHWNMQ